MTPAQADSFAAWLDAWFPGAPCRPQTPDRPPSVCLRAGAATREDITRLSMLAALVPGLDSTLAAELASRPGGLAALTLSVHVVEDRGAGETGPQMRRGPSRTPAEIDSGRLVQLLTEALDARAA